MFILEGPDCVGKTTLAGKIVKALNDLGWPHVYQHMTRLPECWTQDLVMNYMRLMSPYVVMDRFIMSEPLYKVINDMDPWLDPGQYTQLDQTLLSFAGHTMVLCDGTGGSLLHQRYQVEREMFNLEKVLDVNEQYQHVLVRPYWSCPRTGQAYNMRVDCAFSAAVGREYPDLTDCALRAYTLRLKKDFPYPGAKVYGD